MAKAWSNFTVGPFVVQKSYLSNTAIHIIHHYIGLHRYIPTYIYRRGDDSSIEFSGSLTSEYNSRQSSRNFVDPDLPGDGAVRLG